MENNLMHKVYDLVNYIIQPNDLKHINTNSKKMPKTKTCPITKLDISMQPRNSKFLSFTGVRWYYENNYKVYEKKLESRLSEEYLDMDLNFQFRKIAQNIRNQDSNPRRSIRRKINRLLNEQGCLFNNLELIDRRLLKKAGFV